MVIEVVRVSKSFGRIRVLDSVSFKVFNGEVVGYVGLNGAGKTTTIRIATGVLPPDSGEVFIDGYSVLKEKKRASRLVGWVPESPIFEPDFKALDYFTYLAGYYGYSTSEARRLGRELLEKLGLGDALKMKISEYSHGMKKRFALAVSLIGDPPNFLFDEVLHGLDPKGIAFFRGLALEFKKQNKAILFSSHILSEVEGVVDRVVFIHKGKIIGEFSIDEIKQKAQPAVELVLTRVDGSVLRFLEKHGEVVVVSEKKVLLRRPVSDTSQIVAELVTAGIGVSEVKKQERHLEDFFFELIRKAEVTGA